MDGYGISVGFDGQQLVVEPKNALAGVALGGSKLVVTSSALVSVSMTKAGLFRNGRLDLVVRDRRPCQLHFTRKQQADFEKLYRDLLSFGEQVASATGVSSSQPAQSRPAPAAHLSGKPLLLRGAGWFGQEVVGESHYFQALRRLSGKASTGERERLPNCAANRRTPTTATRSRCWSMGRCWNGPAESPSAVRVCGSAEDLGFHGERVARPGWSRTPVPDQRDRHPIASHGPPGGPFSSADSRKRAFGRAGAFDEACAPAGQGVGRRQPPTC